MAASARGWVWDAVTRQDLGFWRNECSGRHRGCFDRWIQMSGAARRCEVASVRGQWILQMREVRRARIRGLGCDERRQNGADGVRRLECGGEGRGLGGLAVL